MRIIIPDWLTLRQGDNYRDLHGGHDLLRQTLIDFADKKTPLSRSEIVRQQQHSGGSGVTAVMVSPASEKGSSNE